MSDNAKNQDFRAVGQKKDALQSLPVQQALPVKSPSDEKFVPTCSVCGEKHWPFHPLAPCNNLKRVKAKTKLEKKAVAAERKKAKAEAKVRRYAEKKTKAQVKIQQAKQLKTMAQTNQILQLKSQLKEEINARGKAESLLSNEKKANARILRQLDESYVDINELGAKLKLESEYKAKLRGQLETAAEQQDEVEAEVKEQTQARIEAEQRIKEQVSQISRLQTEAEKTTQSYAAKLEQVEQKINSLSLQKTECEEIIEQLKSESDLQTKDYTDSIAEIKAENKEALAKQKDKLKAEQTAKAEIQCNAEDSLRTAERTQSKLEFQIKLTDELHEQAGRYVQQFGSLKAETKEKLNAYGEQINSLNDALAKAEEAANIAEELRAQSQAELDNERLRLSKLREELSSYFNDMACAEVKIEEQAEELLTTQELLRAESRSKAEAQQEIKILTGQLNKLKDKTTVTISRVRAKSEKIIAKADANAISESNARVQAEEKVRVYAGAIAEAEKRLEVEHQKRIITEKIIDRQALARAESEKLAKSAKDVRDAIEKEYQAKARSLAIAEEKNRLENAAEFRAKWEARTRTEAKSKIEAEKRVQIYAGAMAEAERRLEVEHRARIMAEQKAKNKSLARAESEKMTRPVENESFANKIPVKAVKSSKPKHRVVDISRKKGTCECCGKEHVPRKKLVKIDSGLLFCPDCCRELNEFYPNCLHALKSTRKS